MLSCEVCITMADGSHGRHYGLYVCTVDAIVRALELFPSAWKISVRALP